MKSEKIAKSEKLIIRPPEGVTLRFTDLPDGRYLKEWLIDPAVDRWFPMADEVEIDDAVARWVGGFYRWRCSLTAIKDGVPIGLSTLYLQPYKKLAHQCEFGIIVSPRERSTGVGSFLLSSLMTLAKDTFKIELLHLQVYAENPAIRLYTRFGFKEFGRQEEWLKEPDGRYRARIFMERWLTNPPARIAEETPSFKEEVST